MAIDAPAHLEFGDGNQVSNMRIGNQMKLVDLLDRSVTRLTFDAGLDVPVVTELNVFWKAMDLNPFDRLLLFPMVFENANAFDLVVLGRKLRMTAHTNFDGGNAR